MLIFTAAKELFKRKFKQNCTMKKFTLKTLVAGALVVSASSVNAQQYTQDFEDTTVADFATLMDGWLNWDLDGFTDANARPQDFYWGAYAVSIDTMVTPWDTTTSLGAMSSSWQEGFVGPTNNQLVSPVFNLGTAPTLTWQSKPYQGPRYLDGYSVAVMATNDQGDWDLSSADIVFEALENANDPAAGTNPSDMDFEGGAGAWYHSPFMYQGDSSGMFPVLSDPITVNLSAYAGQSVVIGFIHDTNDDNLIIFDNLVIDGLASVADNNVKFDVNAYPNPAENNATVSFTLANTADVMTSVYDITGREVMSVNNGTLAAGNQKVQLDVTNLPSGIYNVALSIDGEIANVTIMVK